MQTKSSSVKDESHWFVEFVIVIHFGALLGALAYWVTK